MKKLFKSIYKIIDKFLIVPISRFVYYINKKIKQNGGKLDKLLNSHQFLIYLSLAIAVGTFLLIDSKAISFIQSESDSIANVPVVLKYNAEAYVVEGVPEFVDIRISGRKSDIYLAKQLGEYQVVLDLTDYSPSETAYKVYFSYSKPIENLSYKIDPSYVSVIIKNKISETTSITYDLLNLDKLDPKLSVKSVDLDKNQVVVKGSSTTLEQISLVKALVDLKNKSLTEAGTYTLNDVKLVAYDRTGKILTDVEIVPGTISATVTLDSYSKKVPLSVLTTGSLIPGKAIASILINGNATYSVSIFGDQKELDKVNFVPLTINIDGLGKETAKSYNVLISKPFGVRHMDLKNASIAVTFGDEAQKTIDKNINIASRNLSDGLNVTILPPYNISVQVKGVSSVIDKISAVDVNAYIDLKDLKPGEHEVEVKIDNTNPLVTYVVSSTIKVAIV